MRLLALVAGAWAKSPQSSRRRLPAPESRSSAASRAEDICLQAHNNRQSRAAARFARALLRKFFCSTIAALASSQSGECSPRPASEHGGFQQALPSTQARFHWLKPAGPAALVRYPTMWHIEVKPCRRPCERPAQSCALQVLLHPVATAAARAVRQPAPLPDPPAALASHHHLVQRVLHNAGGIRRFQFWDYLPTP